MDQAKRPESEAETPADRLTPHEPGDLKSAGDTEPERPTGIVDPRRLPGPEILNPPSPGLPQPTEEERTKLIEKSTG